MQPDYRLSAGYQQYFDDINSVMTKHQENQADLSLAQIGDQTKG